ncbi:MAG: DUF5720 family protein [Ruminococcus flavefaciens]|nr:DUF5720 family protein [Ruminococcus flavefaciens]
MTLTEDEKRMLFQLESCSRHKALDEIITIYRYTLDRNRRDTAESLIKKLHYLPETDCRELIRSFQENYHPPQSARTVGELIAIARQRSGAQKLEGHDIMALERFAPDVRHMIVFDVLSDDSTLGNKGEKMRLFLTEAGYQKALKDQAGQSIRILNHAKVTDGNLQYDEPGKCL